MKHKELETRAILMLKSVGRSTYKILIFLFDHT